MIFVVNVCTVNSKHSLHLHTYPVVVVHGDVGENHAVLQVPVQFLVMSQSLSSRLSLQENWSHLQELLSISNGLNVGLHAAERDNVIM